jgi:hypothetical protein
MGATKERKTASHVMMLLKYKPLNQDDALWPWVRPSIKGGDNVAWRRTRRETDKACVLINSREVGMA